MVSSSNTRNVFSTSQGLELEVNIHYAPPLVHLLATRNDIFLHWVISLSVSIYVQVHTYWQNNYKQNKKMPAL